MSAIGVAMQGNKPVQVITYKSGKQEISPFAPTPKVHWLDQGGKVQAVDEYNQQPLGNPFAKSMTPGEIATNGLGWPHLDLQAASDDALCAFMECYFRGGMGR